MVGRTRSRWLCCSITSRGSISLWLHYLPGFSFFPASAVSTAAKMKMKAKKAAANFRRCCWYCWDDISGNEEKKKEGDFNQVRIKIRLYNEAPLPEASGALGFREIVLIIASGILSFSPTTTKSNKSHGHWQYSTTHRIRFHSHLLWMPLG